MAVAIFLSILAALITIAYIHQEKIDPEIADRVLTDMH